MPSSTVMPSSTIMPGSTTTLSSTATSSSTTSSTLSHSILYNSTLLPPILDNGTVHNYTTGNLTSPFTLLPTSVTVYNGECLSSNPSGIMKLFFFICFQIAIVHWL
jgi:hypothetical protein